MKIALSENYAPWASGEGGRVQGLSVDLLRELLTNRMQYAISMRGLPWARAQKDTFAGKYDALCTAKSPERLKYMRLSKQPIYFSELKVYVRSDSASVEKFKNIKTLEDLNNAPIIFNVYLGAGWAAANLTTKNIEYSSSLGNSLRKLATGHGDAVVDAVLVTRHLIKQMGLEKEIKELSIPIGTIDYYFMIRKDSEFAQRMDHFDREFAKYSKTQAYRDLVERYSALN